MKYECVVLGGGTQSAGPGFRAMFDAWGESTGVKLVAGTLNLCADEEPALPREYLPLDDFKRLAPRQGPTLDPRLYPVRVGGRVPAWLYRWSAPEHISIWVGDADGCHREHRLEIVAEVHLKTELGLAPGDRVLVEFTSELDAGQVNG